MVETFLIENSRQARRVFLAGNALGCVIIVVSIEPAWFAGLAGLLLILLAWREWQKMPGPGKLWLSFDSRREIIGLEQGGQTHFFDKYKVYPSRWFAILKLIKPGQTRVLLLVPDRFKTPQDYRACRFNLQQLERLRAA